MLRRLATTHFEPTYARRAFPCFDEPQLKAKFVVTIIHDDKSSVFFNMPLKTQSEVRGKANTVSFLWKISFLPENIIDKRFGEKKLNPFREILDSIDEP